jgi:hypothetical protein
MKRVLSTKRGKPCTKFFFWLMLGEDMNRWITHSGEGQSKQEIQKKKN